MPAYFGAPMHIFPHPTIVNTSMLTVAPCTPLSRTVKKSLYVESTEMEKLEEIHEPVRCLTNASKILFAYIFPPVAMLGYERRERALIA